LYVTEKINPNIFLYQDRTQDDDKSGKRFHRDYDLLMTEYEKDPSDPRTVFYLAQTCSCLNREEESYKYYAIRASMENGFGEERFEAMTRCGDFAMKYTAKNNLLAMEGKQNLDKFVDRWYKNINWNTALGWFMEAMTIFKRIEPLIAMTKFYKEIGQMDLAYMFVNAACMMEYPENSLLFINKHQFEYERWHLLGIVAFYVNKHEDGYLACIKAIKVANQDIDKQNLEHYKKVMDSNRKKHKK
jgi:hypothetical protein